MLPVLVVLAALSIWSKDSFAEDSNAGVDLKILNLGNVEPDITLRPYGPNEPKPDTSYLPFPIPEKVRFDVYHETFMSSILGGHATMEVLGLTRVNGRPALHFKLVARSADWYKWIIIIRNEIEGYLDLETGKSLYVQIRKREGRYRQSKTIFFDYDKRMVVEKEEEKDKGKPKYKYRQYRLAEEVYDAYSVLYLIRGTSLGHTRRIDYTVYSDGKVYKLFAKNLGLFRVKVEEGRYELYKTEVVSKVQGALAQKNGIFMYYTKDSRQLPLLSHADVKVGKFRVLMVEPLLPGIK